MIDSRALLVHFLAALAYRTQKALRGAPSAFADFRAAVNVRSPHELLWHMTSVIGYARTFLHGRAFSPRRLATLADEEARFHETLTALRADLLDASLHATIAMSNSRRVHLPTR